MKTTDTQGTGNLDPIASFAAYVVAHPPGPTPEWLNALLAEREVAPVLPDFVEEGQRDHSLTSLAGSMRERGADADTILSALRTFNQNRVRPPLEDHSLRRIAASVGSYKPGPEKPPMRTDMGNGQRLVWHHGVDLRYSAE